MQNNKSSCYIAYIIFWFKTASFQTYRLGMLYITFFFFFAAAILSIICFCIYVHACVTTIINNMQEEAVHA